MLGDGAFWAQVVPPCSRRLPLEVCRDRNKERLCVRSQEWKAIRVFDGGHVFTYTVARNSPYLTIRLLCVCVSACVYTPPTDKDAGGRAGQLSVAHWRLVNDVKVARMRPHSRRDSKRQLCLPWMVKPPLPLWCAIIQSSWLKGEHRPAILIPYSGLMLCSGFIRWS